MNPLDRHADVITTTVLMGQPFHTGLKGITLETAFDVQDMVAHKLDAPLQGIAGYKIAWNSPEGMAKLEMPHPGMGRVFLKHVHVGRHTVALANYRNLMVEAEIVAFLGEDLEPGQTYTADNVRDAVDAFTVGIEVLDRFDAPPEAGAPEIIAHNVFNAGAVIGSMRIPGGDLDTSRITTRVISGERMLAEGAGLAPQDPLEAIAFLANHFSSRGHTMQAGQFVLCGSHIPLYPISEAEEVSVWMGSLGEVTLKVT